VLFDFFIIRQLRTNYRFIGVLVQHGIKETEHGGMSGLRERGIVEFLARC
jgi:hypothetical protein